MIMMKKYIKIKFNSDDKLPAIKRQKSCHDNNKCYPQDSLDECLYYENKYINKFYKIIKRLYYDRVDVYEGIDVYKESALKECDICH